MKKMVLILILVVPVLIAVVITLIAGFVGRTVELPDIQGVSINRHALMQHYFNPGGTVIFQRADLNPDRPSTNQFEIMGMTEGDSVNVGQFMTILPQDPRITFSALLVEYFQSSTVFTQETSPIVFNNDGFIYMRENVAVNLVIEITGGADIWVFEILGRTI